MTAHRSGQHRIDPTEARRIREEFAFDLLPRAKKVVSSESYPEPVSTDHAEFIAAFRALKLHGWSMRMMARHLGLHHTSVLDMKLGKRDARTAVEDWVARLWDLLGRDVELPSRTGTDASW